MKMNSSVNPWRVGSAPVPIVAWLTGVFEGEAPAIVFVNHAPSFRSERRYGHAFGQVSSTSVPAESHTSVTSSRGSGRRSFGCRASVRALPSGARKSGKSSIAACVGAMSASVVGFVYVPGLKYVEPYNSSGTSWTYPHGPACVRPPSTKFGSSAMNCTWPLRERSIPSRTRCNSSRSAVEHRRSARACSPSAAVEGRPPASDAVDAARASRAMSADRRRRGVIELIRSPSGREDRSTSRSGRRRRTRARPARRRERRSGPEPPAPSCRRR